MPSKSKSQQKFFGMVHAAQTGALASPSPMVKQVAKNISKQGALEFASTPAKNLPMKKTKKGR